MTIRILIVMVKSMGPGSEVTGPGPSSGFAARWL